jgi:hypothetical protein
MSGSKTRSNKGHRILEKVIPSVLGINLNAPKLTGDKEQILRLYIGCLPLLRMMTSIIPVPSPEFLFELYTEEQAKRLLVISAKVFKQVFGKTVFLDTPDIRLAYRALLVFSGLSQIEYEDYLMRKNIKKGPMRGGGKDPFETIFSATRPSVPQKGGVNSPTGSPRATAGTLARRPEGGETAVVGAATAASNAIVAKAEEGRRLALAGQTAARTDLSTAKLQVETETTKVISKIIASDIQRKIVEVLRDETKVFTQMETFMEGLKKQFTENTVIDLGAPHGKIAMHTLLEYAKGDKLLKRSVLDALTASPGNNEKGRPDWFTVNFSAAAAGFGAAVGGIHEFYKTTDYDDHPIMPQMDPDGYSFLTSDGIVLEQKPGAVWVPIPPEGNLKDYPEPFGFYNGTVAVKDSKKAGVKTKGIAGFGRKVIKGPGETPSQKAVKEQAAPYIDAASDDINALKGEKKKVEGEVKSLEARIKELDEVQREHDEADWRTLGLRSSKVAGRKLTEAEQREYDEKKGKLVEKQGEIIRIDAEIAKGETAIDRYQSIVPPDRVAGPGSMTAPNGRQVVGQISYPRDQLTQISSCPIGFNYSDTAATWGCQPVPSIGYLDWDPSAQEYRPSATFTPAGSSKQISCKDLNTYMQPVPAVGAAVVGGLVHRVTKSKVAGALASIVTYYASAENVSRCTSYGAHAVTNSLYSGGMFALAAAGLTAGAYYSYKLFADLNKSREIDATIAAADKEIQKTINESLKEKIRKVFIEKIIHVLQAPDKTVLAALTEKHLSAKLRRNVLSTPNAQQELSEELEDKIVLDATPKLIQDYLQIMSHEIQAAFFHGHRSYQQEYEEYFGNGEKAVQTLIINLVLKDTTEKAKESISNLLKLRRKATNSSVSEKQHVFKYADALSDIIRAWRHRGSTTPASAAAFTGQTVVYNLTGVGGAETYVMPASGVPMHAAIADASAPPGQRRQSLQTLTNGSAGSKAFNAGGGGTRKARRVRRKTQRRRH